MSDVTLSTKVREGGVFVIGISTQQFIFSVNAATSNVKLEIINENSETVFTQNYNTVEKDTNTIFNWDGKNDSGTYIEPGSYEVVITAGEVTRTSSFSAYAQEETGYVSVAVVDINGNSLSNAQISCTNGNYGTDVLLDSESFKGNYPVGEYQYTVTLNGYDKASGVYKVTTGDRSKVSIVMLSSDMEIEESGIQDGIVWKLTKNGELILTGKYTGAENGQDVDFENYEWTQYSSKVYCAYVDVENLPSLRDMFWQFPVLKRVSFGTYMKQGTVVTMRSAFNSASLLTNIDFTNLNTENVTNMFRTFSGCSSLTSLDLSDFDTGNVTDMGWMFAECTKLTKLNVSSFDTSKVTNMKALFDKCFALTSVNVSSFDTSNVTDMGGMFEQCKALKTVDVSNFCTENVTSMTYMF